MPTPAITPLVYAALTLLLDLIKMGKEAKALSEQELADIKKRVDKEFSEFPTWDEL